MARQMGNCQEIRPPGWLFEYPSINSPSRTPAAWRLPFKCLANARSPTCLEDMTYGERVKWESFSQKARNVMT